MRRTARTEQCPGWAVALGAASVCGLLPMAALALIGALLG